MTNSRRTAFPRVKIESIEAVPHEPEEGETTFQYFPYNKADMEDLRSRIMDITGTGKDLEYNLEVIAMTPRGAEATARAYVRSVNPLNFEVMRTSSGPEKIEMGIYSISIAVTH